MSQPKFFKPKENHKLNENKHYIHRRNDSNDCRLLIQSHRNQLNNIFKVTKGKNCHPRNTTASKNFLVKQKRNKDIFKQRNIRKFVMSRPE